MGKSLKEIHKEWFKGGKKAKADTTDGTFPLKAPPRIPTAPSNKTYEELTPKEIDGCLALAHGMGAEYAGAAIKKGLLLSGMRRLGPESTSYGRQADAQGGGAATVYTRAIFGSMSTWPASGHGVGSSEGRVQLLIDPLEVLKDDDSWHINSTDGMGYPPGGSSGVGLSVSWTRQTRWGRASLFRNMAGKSTDAKNNELMHWDSLDLRNRLIAVIYTGQETAESFTTFLESAENGVADCDAWVGRLAESPRNQIQVGASGGYAPIFHFAPTRDIKSLLEQIQQARRQ